MLYACLHTYNFHEMTYTSIKAAAMYPKPDLGVSKIRGTLVWVSFIIRILLFRVLY